MLLLYCANADLLLAWPWPLLRPSYGVDPAQGAGMLVKAQGRASLQADELAGELASWQASWRVSGRGMIILIGAL